VKIDCKQVGSFRGPDASLTLEESYHKPANEAPLARPGAP